MRRAIFSLYLLATLIGCGGPTDTPDPYYDGKAEQGPTDCTDPSTDLELVECYGATEEEMFGDCTWNEELEECEENL